MGMTGRDMSRPAAAGGRATRAGLAVGWVSLLLFCLGYGWIALVATGTKLVFQWPGLVAIGLSLVCAMFAGGLRRRVSLPCLLSFVLAAAYCLVRALLSPVQTVAQADVVLVLVCLGTYLLFSLVLFRPGPRAVFVGLLLVFAVLNFFVAFYQKTADYSYSVMPGHSRNVRVGALPGGLFNLHPHLGAYLVVGSMYGIAVALFARGGVGPRLTALFCGVLAIGGIVLSASRGGLLGFGVGVAMLALCWLIVGRRLYPAIYRRASISACVVGAVFLVVVGIVAVGNFSERFGGSSKLAELLAPRGRQYYSRAAIGQFAEAPAFGNGAGSFRYKFLEHRPEDMIWHQPNPYYAHNDYFQVLAEYGVVGLGLICVAALIHFACGFRLLGGRRPDRPPVEQTGAALLVGALSVAGAFAVLSGFDFNLRLVATAVPVVFSLAVFSVPPPRAATSPRPTRWLRLVSGGVVRAMPGLVGATLLALAWGNAAADTSLEKAQREMRGGALDAAVPHLHRAIELRPDHADAHRDLALVRFRATEGELPAPLESQYVKLAIEGFDRALELHPFDWWTLSMKSECYTILGWNASSGERREALWRRSAELLEQAIELAPTTYTLYQQRAQHYLNVAIEEAAAGDTRGALGALAETFDSYDDVVRHYSVGSPHHKHRVIRRSALKLLEALGYTEADLDQLRGDGR